MHHSITVQNVVYKLRKLAASKFSVSTLIRLRRLHMLEYMTGSRPECCRDTYFVSQLEDGTVENKYNRRRL